MSSIFFSNSNNDIVFSLQYAYARNATQTDLNNNPIQFRQVSLNAGTFSTNIPGVTLAGNEFQNLPSGWYLVNAVLGISSNSARANLSFRLQVNGVTRVGISGFSGYIRAASGHNTSSVHLNGLVELTDPLSTMNLVAQREAAAGIITTSNTAGQFSVIRVT